MRSYVVGIQFNAVSLICVCSKVDLRSVRLNLNLIHRQKNKIHLKNCIYCNKVMSSTRANCFLLCDLIESEVRFAL